MRPFGSAPQLARRRFKAIELLEQGYASGEVARRVGTTRRSVDLWRSRYRQGGQEALLSKPLPGRPPKLSDVQKQRLEKILLQGAQAAGYPTELWTCPRIAALIENQFGVIYHVDHIGRLLHALGWSPQKPARRAIERNEEAISNWIKRDWERAKKKPPG
jgi:transposase